MKNIIFPATFLSFLLIFLILVGCIKGGNAGTQKGDSSGGTGCFVMFSNGEICKQTLPDPPAESSSRFKVEINEISLLEHNESEHLVHGRLELRLIPTVQSDLKSVKVFVGLLGLHDASKISKESAETKNKQCHEVLSCVDSKAWLRTTNPTILVGGTGSTGVPFYWSFKYPDTAKRLRLHWEFYQEEHDPGLRCEPDYDRPYPADGIPFVHAVDANGIQIARWCYGDVETLDFVAPHLIT
jgi:hypothetical protein